MDATRILVIVLLIILHYVLAGMLLDDISKRKRVLGGKKIPWVIAILCVIFVGSLLYLLCHPKIFYDSDSDNEQQQ
ncbi:MAG: hypothetical protein A2Z15_08515 [Chloroflexi bacterium RBG_16_50_11]|nr:MAG: hypothetical protein A2Z15_08515 [Chloroflexi bacterium RBG_16_50_11]